MKGCKYFPSYKAKTSCNEQKCYSKGECVQVTKLINGESICVPYKSNSDDNCTNPILNPDGLWDEVDMCAVVGVVDTNTVNVSLVYDSTSQTIILTDSDGNVLTEDVSGLVSPPDVDFAFTTVDILGTQVTITYFDSNGDLITDSVFTLPAVVDNGDGTFTYNGITWATDDDITAVAFVANGTDLQVTVEEGATSFTGTLPILDVANALCADPNASAVLKACVDTNTTNTTLVLGANNVLTLTDTDGNTVTEDLSGLISPPDIDFASTNEALDNNGDLVITYLDANGVIIDTSIVPISAITTVTNEGGSVTYTHSDGTSWTVAPDTFATTTYAQNTDDDGVTTTTITHTPAGGGTPVVTVIESGGDVEHIGKDCSGADINLETTELFTKANHTANNSGFVINRPFADPCVPEDLPDCYADVYVTTISPLGHTYESLVGSTSFQLAPIAVSRNIVEDSFVIPSVILNSGELDQFFADNGTTSTEVATDIVTITNRDCVPMSVEGELRGLVQNQLGAGNRVIVSLVATQVGLTNSGTPGVTYDTRNFVGTHNSTAGTAYNNFYSPVLAPGATASFAVSVRLRFQNFVSSPANNIAIQSTVGRLEGETYLRRNT